MADLKLNNITPDGVGKIKLGNTNVQKIYNGSTLVWPIDSSPQDPIDPYTPINGTARLITANDGAIKLYDTSLNQITPTNPFSSLPNTDYELAGTSDNLTYMVACGARYNHQDIKISQDGGVTFSSPSTGAFATKWQDTVISKSGQVILSAVTPEVGADLPTTDENFMLSTDYGSNFTKITFPDITGVGYVRSVGISSGGKYIALSFIGYSEALGALDYLFYSSNYGVTWVRETSFGLAADRKWRILMSGTGQYIIFIDESGTNNSWYSSDYGTTFSAKDYNFSGTQMLSSGGVAGSVMDTSGQYYMLSKSLAGVVYYGDDYAVTPSNTVADRSVNNLRLSNNGETQFWYDEGASTPTYGISLDFGATWTTGGPLLSFGAGPVHIIDVE